MHRRQLVYEAPVIRPIRMRCGEITVKVGKSVKWIVARVIVGATNMRTKEGAYVISLSKRD